MWSDIPPWTCKELSMHLWEACHDRQWLSQEGVQGVWRMQHMGPDSAGGGWKCCGVSGVWRKDWRMGGVLLWEGESAGCPEIIPKSTSSSQRPLGTLLWMSFIQNKLRLLFIATRENIYHGEPGGVWGGGVRKKSAVGLGFGWVIWGKNEKWGVTLDWI